MEVSQQYFKLEKGAQQSDPVSAYLVILCIEILFTIVKNNKDIKSLKILENSSYIQLMQMTGRFS